MNDFDTFTKFPKNGEDYGKLIVAKGFKKLPKVQNIAQSGHTDDEHWEINNQRACTKNLFRNQL